MGYNEYMKKILIIVLIFLAIGLVIFGVFLKNKPAKPVITSSLEFSKSNPIAKPVDDLPVIEIPKETCRPVDSTNLNLSYCVDLEQIGVNKMLIKFSSTTIASHVKSYSISPNKQWLLVVSYSAEFVKNPGAPDENSLYMVETSTGRVTELFSQIYFPTYNSVKSWSPNGNGIVFTASSPAKPYDLSKSDYFSVVYCSTTCRVLANNAGPAGVGGDPAYFENGKVHYTDKSGNPVSIEFE